MNIFNRMLLKKKIIKVNEIPKDFLACKSQNTELEKKLNYVSFYYLNNGTRLLSVLNNSNNNSLEVLNILNSLDKIFHIKYDNLIVRKSDEKLLAFSYPLISKKSEIKVDMQHLVNIISDSNDPGNLKACFFSKELYKKNEARDILLSTMLWYKIFKYMNLNKISVRNLNFADIIGYNQTYISKYIYIMNVVAKLDILDSDKENQDLEEEIEVVKICLDYFLNASKSNIYSYEFNKFLKSFKEKYNLYKNGILIDYSFFKNMDFLKTFYNQFENIVEFSCSHEHDKSFFRCTLCNNFDKVISSFEYNNISSNIILEDEHFTVYSPCYILFKEEFLTDEKINTIKEYVNSISHAEFNYSYVYNEKLKLVALNLKVTHRDWENFDSVKNNDVQKHIDMIMDKLLINVEDGSFQEFCEIFYRLYSELFELDEAGFSLNIEDKFDYKKVLNSFLLLDVLANTKYGITTAGSILNVKLTSLKFSEDDVYMKESISDIVANVMFSIIKAKCNSRIENGKLVSDGFDIINLFNLNIVSEYKKFLKGEVYDSEIVMEILEDCCLEEIDETFNYDTSYVLSPRIFKSVLKEEFDASHLKEVYEFRVANVYDNDELLYKLLNFKKSNNQENSIEVILPEYIVYSNFDGKLKYEGYWIKRQNKEFVMNAFNKKLLKQMCNKDVMKRLLLFYHYMNKYPQIQEFPVEHLCFDNTFSKMFISYKICTSVKSSVRYFYDLINDLKSSSLYFAEFLEIIEKGEFSDKKEKTLTKIYESFTKYCEVHNIYYEDTLYRCPVCNKYYEYVDGENIYKKIEKRMEVIYENKNYILVPYKSKFQLKLYKFADEEKTTLANGKSIIQVEEQLINILEKHLLVDNVQKYCKIVKDINTEKVIGVVVSNDNLDLIPISEFLAKHETNNVLYIELVKKLVKKFENISFIFANLQLNTNVDIDDFLNCCLYYNEKKNNICVSDYEFFYDFSTNINLNAIENLDKVIKFIFSYNKKCYDLRTIEYPEIDYNYTKNMSVILKDLVNYYTNETSKLCNRHLVRYNEVDGMCPLCMEEESEVWIKKATDKGKEVNFGGEGFIYTLGRSNFIKAYKVNKVSSGNEKAVDEVKKVLEEEERLKNTKRQQVLKVTQKLYYATQKELEYKNFIIAFPKKNVYVGRQRNFIGFVQDRVVDPISFSLFTNIEKCKELGFDTPLSLLEVLISYGEGIEYLHNSKTVRDVTEEGIVLGDVSGRNVLYSRYLKKVAIIDMDSVGIKDVPASVLTDEYSDPLTVNGVTIIKNFSFDSDWYSYAIICFYILTKVHPFDGMYNPPKASASDKNMSITERKEKKISVIGKYKDVIKLPKIVVDWDWMPNYLLDAFIDIFENEKRYSILNLLKRAYNELAGVNKYEIGKITEIVSKNEQFNKVVNAEELKCRKSTNSCGELLAMFFSVNEEFVKYSSSLIIKNSNVYYKEELEKNILCSDKLDFKDLSYNTENEIKAKSTTFMYDEIFVRDNNGIATCVEDNKKYIYIIKSGAFIKLYMMSNVNRKFKILYDEVNDKYLLISLDNTKSYIVLAGSMKVQNYADVYEKPIDSIEIFKKELFEFKVAYVGNSIYYAENGYICRLNLNNGLLSKIENKLVSEQTAIKVVENSIFAITSSNILKIK